MCPRHRKVIDEEEEAYTVERLARMKAEHADRVGRPDNTFGERAAALLLNQSLVTVNQLGGIAANNVQITIHPGPIKAAAGPRLSVLA